MSNAGARKQTDCLLEHMVNAIARPAYNLTTLGAARTHKGLSVAQWINLKV